MEITAAMSSVPVAAGELPVYVARPNGTGKHPGIIVLMEAFGLNQHMKSVTDRIAAEGYVAVSPDLYFRESTPVVGYDELPAAIRMMSRLSDEVALDDLGAVIEMLRVDAGVDGNRIGVTGFCMGGRFTFLTACRNPAIKAAVAFYGGGIAQVMHPSERTPRAPLDYAEQLAAPMLLFFGGRDAFIPAESVEKVRSRLAELGKDAETVIYPEADHGFFCDERPSFDAEAAADAWQRMTGFFARHLRDA